MRNNLLHCNKLGTRVGLYGLHARYEEVYICLSKNSSAARPTYCGTN